MSRLSPPFYVHPAEDPQAWRELREARSRLGFVVVNVASGPGLVDDHYYPAALLAAQDMPLVGYVNTDHGRRDLDTVVSAALAWRGWYGIDQIMLDCVSTSPDSFAATAEMASVLRRKGFQMIVANPGTRLDNGLAELFDVVCDAEESWRAYREIPDREFVRAAGSAPRWHLIHSCPHEAIPEALELAQKRGAEHVWVTDGLLPNPWSRIPRDMLWHVPENT